MRLLIVVVLMSLLCGCEKEIREVRAQQALTVSAACAGGAILAWLLESANVISC